MQDDLILLLKPVVQHYDWGPFGESSRVANLCKTSMCGYVGSSGRERNWQIPPNKPFAELWVGDHPNGPSWVHTIRDQEISMTDYIKASSGSTEGTRLPFLLKCLSVAKPLSIQVHPDNDTAKTLNVQDPSTYKDSNHKPEVAIALSEFEALCGFRKSQAILSDIKRHPELLALIGQSLDSSFWNDSDNKFSVTCLEKCLKAEPSIVVEALRTIMSHIKAKGEDVTASESLFLRLNEIYPGNVGVLGVFFLQYWKLDPGTALFIPPNVPHTYLKGDCIECMTSSDNVVRGGLTPKTVNADLFIQLARNATQDPRLITALHTEDGHYIYRPPISDFEIHRIEIPAGSQREIILRSKHPPLGIVLAGQFTVGSLTLSEGDCFTPRQNKLISFCGVDGKSEIIIALAPLP